ncbi:MAG TPA: NAD(P)-dependent oxidoreductase [Candidatus Dormibacteraeota bacterium]|nr:NAD(P)-dependent oxidoreductase [Candidatus Dormibacteraeota bacterium]
MRVAILGTGKMGAAMAKRLDGQGHQLRLWNRTRSRAEAVGVGTVAATPAEAVRDAEVVLSILTDAAAVRSAYLGASGAVEAARDQVFVEMSTAGPEVSKEIAARVPAYVEAPLFGSVGAMAGGTGVILAAGDRAAIERARPVLADIGDVRIIGELGSAAALKLIGNTMLADLYAVASELMSAGVAAGLPAEEVFFILNRFAPLLTQRKAGFVEHRYEPVTFALRDMVKDLKLGHDLFQRIGVSTPMSDETRRLFEKVMPEHADDEVTAIASLYEGQTARSRR